MYAGPVEAGGQGARRARGLGEPGRGITPQDKSITLFLKFIIIAIKFLNPAYCYSQFYKILS